MNTASRPSLLFPWDFYAIRPQDDDHLHEVERAEHVAYIQLRGSEQVPANAFEWQPVVYPVWLLGILQNEVTVPLHFLVLILIQDRVAVHDLVFLYDLLLYLAFVLTVVGGVDDILQLAVIAYLKSTNFLTIKSNVDTLNLLHKLNSHFLIAQAALLLVTRHLDEAQVTVNALVVDVDASFNVRLHLHFYFKDVVLFQDLLLRLYFGCLFLLRGDADINLKLVIRVLISHFRHLLFVAWVLILLIWILLLTLLQHMDYLPLM